MTFTIGIKTPAKVIPCSPPMITTTPEFVLAKRIQFKGYSEQELHMSKTIIIQKQKYLLFEWSLIKYYLEHPRKVHHIKKYFSDITPSSFSVSQTEIETYAQNPKFIFRFSLHNFNLFKTCFASKKFNKKEVSDDMLTYALDDSAMVPYASYVPMSFLKSSKSIKLTPHHVKEFQNKYIYHESRPEDLVEVYYSDDFFLHEMDANTPCSKFAECLLTGMNGEKKLPLLSKSETTTTTPDDESYTENKKTMGNSLRSVIKSMRFINGSTFSVKSRSVYEDDIPLDAFEYLGEEIACDPAVRHRNLIRISNMKRGHIEIMDKAFVDPLFYGVVNPYLGTEDETVNCSLPRNVNDENVSCNSKPDTANTFPTTSTNKRTIASDVAQKLGSLFEFDGNDNDVSEIKLDSTIDRVIGNESGKENVGSVSVVDFSAPALQVELKKLSQGISDEAEKTKIVSRDDDGNIDGDGHTSISYNSPDPNLVSEVLTDAINISQASSINGALELKNCDELITKVEVGIRDSLEEVFSEQLIELDLRKADLKHEFDIFKKESRDHFTIFFKDEMDNFITQTQEHAIAVGNNIQKIGDEIKVDLKDQMKKELLQELKTDLRNEILSEIKQEIRQEIRQEIKSELKAELLEELQLEMKSDLDKDFSLELKERIEKNMLDFVKDEINAKVENEVDSELTETREKLALFVDDVCGELQDEWEGKMSAMYKNLNVELEKAKSKNEEKFLMHEKRIDEKFNAIEDELSTVSGIAKNQLRREIRGEYEAIRKEATKQLQSDAKKIVSNVFNDHATKKVSSISMNQYDLVTKKMSPAPLNKSKVKERTGNVIPRQIPQQIKDVVALGLK